jgi:hypothetical protein
MSATLNPYVDGSHAYIPVRIPDGPRTDGSVLAYLPDGTALVVKHDQLVHLDTDEIATS